jgi:transcriptional regulator with XRE-family HTH domain
MPSKERLIQLGTRRGERLRREFADEIREARMLAGLTQETVARVAGMSKSRLSRIETAQGTGLDFVTASRVAQIVGLDLSVRCFPAGGRLRDEAHIALIDRFMRQLHPSIQRRLEAPIPLPGDQRAWDLLLHIGSTSVGVAAETSLRDIQALLRREQAKQRDGRVDRLLVVVANTRANRIALRQARPVWDQQLGMGTWSVMRALRRGVDPGGDGWAMV